VVERGRRRCESHADLRTLRARLGAALLDRALRSGVVVLDVAEIQAMIAVTGSNVFRDEWFVLGDRLVYATMVPWLPGVDYRAAVAEAHPDLPVYRK